MTAILQEVLSELRDRFQGLYADRLADMILFGSQARGEAEDASDIDVLVVLIGRVNPADEVSKSSEIVADISLRNDVVISCVFIDEESFLHRNGPLLRNVRREGIRV